MQSTDAENCIISNMKIFLQIQACMWGVCTCLTLALATVTLVVATFLVVQTCQDKQANRPSLDAGTELMQYGNGHTISAVKPGASSV